jgi:hypothetical protein
MRGKAVASGDNEIVKVRMGERGKIRQMESFAYPHFSSTAHVALFNCVTNAAQLRARIVRASSLEGDEGDAEREAVNFAFVDARLVGRMFVASTPMHLFTKRLHTGDEHPTYPNGHHPSSSGRNTKRA